MHTISGTLATADAADKVREALAQAGVTDSAIAVDATGEGDTQLMSLEVDDNLVDAAMAILGQAGASDVNDTDHSANSVEGEEAQRMRDTIPPIAGAQR